MSKVQAAWVELHERIEVAIGATQEEEFTAPVVKMDYYYAAKWPLKVIITWKLDDEDYGIEPMVDEGYLFSMPGIENDPFISGIVHIPCPKGEEQGEPEPVWSTLYDLERNDMIDSIKICPA